MKKGITFPNSRIQTTIGVEMIGESLEQKLRKALEGKEPIKADAKITYNERKLGVLPEYDIRTDRWELALEATGLANKSMAAKRHFEDFPELYQKDKDGNFIMDKNGNPQLIKPAGEA